MDGYMGEVRMFAGNFAPRNWQLCNGQLLPISQFSALFSLLGTYYGGNGRTDFAVPDFRGRAPMGTGQHPGSIYNWQLGNRYGFEQVVLNIAHMPSHTHLATTTISSGTLSVDGSHFTGTIMGTDVQADEQAPDGGRVLAESSANYFKDGGTASIATQPGSVSISGSAPVAGSFGASTVVDNNGGSAAFSILNPIQIIHFIICVEGTYPSRN